jgi:hypothetical protein
MIASHDKLSHTQSDIHYKFSDSSSQVFTRKSDGSQITTYVNDKGIRMYLDWETAAWSEFPEEWYSDVTVADELLQDESIDSEASRLLERIPGASAWSGSMDPR